MRQLAALLFWLLMTAIAWPQQDICSGYQQSPDSPHKGPRKFNTIHLAFAHSNTDVLIFDPRGHRFGVGAPGKTLLREIPRAFYEDDSTAENDSGLPRSERPREISIHYAQSGRYLIVLTAAKNKAPWLKVKTSTCGKRWQKEVTAPVSPEGTVARFTLIYDSHAGSDPQLLEGDHRPSQK